MRSILLVCLLASVIIATAQGQLDKDLSSLVETELAFARMAKEQNTRDAFLRYLSDETVMFMNSKISKGKKSWEERKPDSSLIIWEPIFADISVSGDFGYTTGPSEYYASRKPGERAYDGSYITVWKKQGGGDWKMGIDIGVYPQPKPVTKSLSTPGFVSLNNSQKTGDTKPGLMEQERRLIKELSSNGGKQFEVFIATAPRFYRAGIEPVISGAKIRELISREAGTIEYTLVDGEVSSAGDLGYVYGRMKIKDHDKVSEGFYLRIYKKVKNEWKVVLDAIHQ